MNEDTVSAPPPSDTGKIANDNRLDKSLRTIEDIVSAGAAVVMIAHQGDTHDYQNLVSLAEHAEKLSEKLSRPVAFIDDVAGPAARARIEALQPGELLLLDNLRYLTEEVSTFESAGCGSNAPEARRTSRRRVWLPTVAGPAAPSPRPSICWRATP